MRDAASWLEGMDSVFGETSQSLGWCRQHAGGVWIGVAADAYDDTLERATNAADDAKKAAGTLKELFLSYANQLEWRKEDMQKHRDEAGEEGLEVRGTVIVPPTPLTRPIEPQPEPTPSSTPWLIPAEPDPASRAKYRERMAAYNESIRLAGVYDKAVTKVGGTRERLYTWIAENLVVDPAEQTGLTLAQALADSSTTLGGGASAGNDALESIVKDLDHEARSYPRGDGAPWASAADMERGLPGLSRALKRIGFVAESVGAVYALTEGASPSSLIIGLATGAGGSAAGAAAGSALGTLTGPAAPVAVPILAAGGAWAGDQVFSGAAEAVYEAWIPQHLRQEADEFLSDLVDPNA